MADGTTKAIGSIALGETVVATDPTTGETTNREVTQLHTNTDTDLTDLTVTVDPDPQIDGDETIETLYTTSHHPFWDATQDQWVDAADLKTGDKLHSTGSAAILVKTVRNYAGSHTMNDLTVADVHTYYVVVGATPVLVHNNSCKLRTLKIYEIDLANGTTYVGRTVQASLARRYPAIGRLIFRGQKITNITVHTHLTCSCRLRWQILEQQAMNDARRAGKTLINGREEIPRIRWPFFGIRP
jgi:flagellin-like hook-associated protein FlgL